MAKIIFWTGIWPKWTSRPIGTYQLAHWLRSHNISAQVIDFCQWHSSEELVELTELFISDETKYIGISTSFWANGVIPDNIKSAIDIIRKYKKDIKIVFGGPRADSTTLKDYADIILLGEAENSLLNLIKGHNIGSKLFDITQLDHRFDERDCIIDGEVLPLELGRGCIFKCKFCGHHNIGKPKHTYQRCMHLIEEEIAYNYETFKTTRYHFLDDTINEDTEKVENLSKIPTKTGVNISWTGYLRADLLWSNPDTPYQLKESGMHSCFFGIETFHRKASIIIGKGWSGKHAKEFLPKLFNDIWQKEIPIWNNFIVGLPGETEEDLTDTLEWCKNNSNGTNYFVPLSLYTTRTDNGPRSNFFNNYAEYGYSLDSDGRWVSNIMSEQESYMISRKFNDELMLYNKTASWALSDLLNCGIDISVGKCILLKNWPEYRNSFLPFLEIYKKKLKGIS